jgi:hypothetical protein
VRRGHGKDDKGQGKWAHGGSFDVVFSSRSFAAVLAVTEPKTDDR